MARYPLAQWIGASSANYSVGQITHKRVVIHIEQGSESGTAGWFNNPKAQVSAHFGNPKVGKVQQFVDTDQTAWHCAQFNGESIGIEHEGFSGGKLNKNQLKNLKALLIWIHRVHGTPLVFTNQYTESGVIGHGKLPEGTMSHPDCPGEPILAQVNVLIHQINHPNVVKRVIQALRTPKQV